MKGETMYRETLIEQKKLFEERQKACDRLDTSDFIELGRNIISLAQRIDEYDSQNAPIQHQFNSKPLSQLTGVM